MTLKVENKSFNSSVNPKKEYTRKIYQCEDDDVWTTIEIPIEKL